MTKASRTRLDVDERRALLLDAAAQLFDAHAFDDVSVEDVARAAGVSKGLLYHYFPGKRELYVAHVERGATNVLTAIQEAVAAVDLAAGNDERLRAALRGWMLHVQAHPRTYEAVVRGGHAADTDVQRIAAGLRKRFAQLLGHALGPVATSNRGRILTMGWIGFVESATLAWVHAADDVPSDVLIDAAVRVLASSLAIDTD